MKIVVKLSKNKRRYNLKTVKIAPTYYPGSKFYFYFYSE